MKETRKQKIDRQRGRLADRAFDPIRRAIDDGSLVITPASLPRVQVINREHPHFEEYGRFTGKVVTMNFGDRKPMAEVKLEHCRHGTDACFVSQGDVRRVEER